MAKRTIDLHFPSGVVRRLGLRAASKGRREYSAPWGLNVRLEDSLTNRLRGGSFTGLTDTTADLQHFDGVELVTEDLDDIITEGGDDLIIGAGNTVTVKYRDRAITFKDNEVWASRQGKYKDLELRGDLTDVRRPILLQLSEAAEMGDDVVAVVPHKDAYMLMFTETSTWVLSGDPATGTLRRVSDQVGIIGEHAWCVAHDTVYFLSSQGLYSVGANGGDLKAISEDVIPEDLTGVSDTACVLAYQHSDRGVYIKLTTDPDWFYDIAREQFWPFDTDTANSHLLIGPIKLNSLNELGMVTTMHGIMAQGSADVSWHIVPGDTAEEAAANGKAAITAALAGSSYSTYVRESGTWEAGRSQTARPRVSAMYVCIWLSSAGTWAYEGITLGMQPNGSWRK
jgi:hypothetical protein